MGGSEEGIPLLVQGLAVYRNTGANLLVPFYLTMLAEVHGMAAQPDEGLNQLAEAATLVEATKERWAEAEIHRLRGDLLDAVGDRATAEQSYLQAISVARQQSAKFFELRASASLARFWRNQGKRTEARDLLAPIYGWFAEGVAAPVLREAKALLEQLST